MQVKAMPLHPVVFCVMQYHAMQYHGMQIHTMQYHAMQCHAMPYHAITCHTLPNRSKLCNLMSDTMPCNTILCQSECSSNQWRCNSMRRSFSDQTTNLKFLAKKTIKPFSIFFASKSHLRKSNCIKLNFSTLWQSQRKTKLAPKNSRESQHWLLK